MIFVLLIKIFLIYGDLSFSVSLLCFVNEKKQQKTIHQINTNKIHSNKQPNKTSENDQWNGRKRLS